MRKYIAVSFLILIVSVPAGAFEYMPDPRFEVHLNAMQVSPQNSWFENGVNMRLGLGLNVRPWPFFFLGGQVQLVGEGFPDQYPSSSCEDDQNRHTRLAGTLWAGYHHEHFRVGLRYSRVDESFEPYQCKTPFEDNGGLRSFITSSHVHGAETNHPGFMLEARIAHRWQIGLLTDREYRIQGWAVWQLSTATLRVELVHESIPHEPFPGYEKTIGTLGVLLSPWATPGARSHFQLYTGLGFQHSFFHDESEWKPEHRWAPLVFLHLIGQVF